MKKTGDSPDMRDSIPDMGHFLPELLEAAGSRWQEIKKRLKIMVFKLPASLIVLGQGRIVAGSILLMLLAKSKRLNAR